VLADDAILDYAGSMPQDMIKEFRARLNGVVSSILKQWDTFAEETDVTGYLKGRFKGLWWSETVGEFLRARGHMTVTPKKSCWVSI